MKKIVKSLIVFVMVLCFIPISSAFADDHEDMETHVANVDTVYTLENDVVTEYVTMIDSEGNLIEMTRNIYPNETLDAVIKKNGEIKYTYSLQNIDYSFFLDLAIKSLQIVPMCNLPDATYRHEFLYSETTTIKKSDIVTITTGQDVSFVVGLLSAAFTNVPGAAIAGFAYSLYSWIAGSYPDHSMVIMNYYKVYRKSDNHLMGFCYHMNTILYDSGGHVTGGGGMSYQQSW